MDFFTRINRDLKQADGLEAYYVMQKHGTWFGPKSLMTKFTDNSFWARDIATRNTAAQIKSSAQLVDVVQYAFKTPEFEQADEAAKDLYLQGLSKTAGLVVRRLGIEYMSQEGIDILTWQSPRKGRPVWNPETYRYETAGKRHQPGSQHRTLIWNPEGGETAAVNRNGKIQLLKDNWQKSYPDIRYSPKAAFALV